MIDEQTFKSKENYECKMDTKCFINLRLFYFKTKLLKYRGPCLS